jgi:hypothetical protein
MGRMLVIPSRAESLPYVVLEAAAAGVPIIATASAAFRKFSDRRRRNSFRPTTSRRWSAPSRRRSTIRHRCASRRAGVKARVRSEFSLTAMVECNGLAAYREAIALRKVAQFT